MFAAEMGWSTGFGVSSEGTPLVISQRPQTRGIQNAEMAFACPRCYLEASAKWVVL